MDMAHDRGIHSCEMHGLARFSRRSRQRRWRLFSPLRAVGVGVAAIVAFSLVAHRGTSPVRVADPPARITTDPRAAFVGRGIFPAKLLVEPKSGVRPLTRILDHAQRTIFVECYILTDRSVIRALERASAQGVNVYVLLEPHPFGLGTQPVRVADELRAAGISVRWSSPSFALTHAKFIVVDDRVVVISTANLSHAAFHTNREFLVVETGRYRGRLLSALFRADWDRAPFSVNDRDIVISPIDSRQRISTFLRTAIKSVRLYAEEIGDVGMERALVSLARLHLDVRVLLAWGQSPSAVHFLAGGGVAVRETRALYIHAKAMSIDSREAFVGSQNLSTQSLDENREVGILLRGPAVERIDRTFDADWQRAVPIK